MESKIYEDNVSNQESKSNDLGRPRK